MDPKRKKLYIFLIIGCVLGTVAVLMWGLGSGGSGSSATLTDAISVTPVGSGTPSPATTSTIKRPTTPGGIVTYSAPAVFPANNNFDSSVLNSATFKSFQSYQPIQIQPSDLGRADPFSKY